MSTKYTLPGVLTADEGTLLGNAVELDFTGAGVTATLGVDGVATISIPGGGGAPTNAQYLVLALDGVLTDERRFVPGTGLTAVDGGAGGDYTLNASPGTPAITVVTSTPYAAAADTFLVVKPSVSTIVINLPAGVLDKSIIIKHGNASLFDVQVNANGADTIDGQASYLLTTRQSLTITFEGGVWHSR